MISKFLELVFTFTSISPVFLAIWFREVINSNNLAKGWFWLVVFIASVVVAWLVIQFSRNKLEVVPINVKSVAPANKEVAAFLIAYILPLVNIDGINIQTILFIVFILYIAVWTTSNYHFNPVLTLFFRYHYYEITVEDKIGDQSFRHTYILMTKKTIRHCKDIKKVVQVSDYMLMEVE